MAAGGHKITTPSYLTYSSVVSRDSIRKSLIISALDDLKVLVCDIQNAHLTETFRENIWTVAWPELFPEKGKIMLVVRELYGLKSSGEDFRALLAEKLHDLGYRQSIADFNVRMRPSLKPGGFMCYYYVL